MLKRFETKRGQLHVFRNQRLGFCSENRSDSRNEYWRHSSIQCLEQGASRLMLHIVKIF